uniref:Uncharacterized protein n=1 Tax=Suricata suricatta TaxID=37032 RepID=A0A673SU98_SURSU
MAEQPAQQHMKTSFLFIQLQAPLARALPSQSPASAAWTAAPGGPEEGHIFPSPRTGFLAGWDLRHKQSWAAPPSLLLKKGGSGTEEPAAFSCSALKEEEREEKPQDLDLRRGGVCRSPHDRLSLAPASRKFGRLQPLSCRLPIPDPIMSNESSSPSTGWKHRPVITAPLDQWSMDPQSRDALGCSIPQTTLTHATDGGESAMLRRGVATCQVLPKNCEEGSTTTVRARRARLYRYCPPIQTSKSFPALSAALPLKQLTGTPEQQYSKIKNNKNRKHKPHSLNWGILIP